MLTTDIIVFLIDDMLNILAFLLKAICHQNSSYTSTDCNDSNLPIPWIFQCPGSNGQCYSVLVMGKETHKSSLIVDMVICAGVRCVLSWIVLLITPC